jgi:putative transcriptional regulator
MTAAKRLYRLRCRLRLTQRAFAERFALPYGVIKDVEQGRFQPVQSFVVLLAAIEAAPEIVAKAALNLGKYG